MWGVSPRVLPEPTATVHQVMASRGLWSCLQPETVLRQEAPGVGAPWNMTNLWKDTRTWGAAMS